MQVNILVSQALASFEAGAKSWLFYADRLYQLPLGIVGVAVGVAILPRLARAARGGDGAAGHILMDNGIGLAMALTLPASVALMLAPDYLISGLYERGAFLAEDARQAGRALVHFGWGVPAFVLIKVVAPAYFAREDTMTPMRYSLVAIGLNTIVGAGLFIWLRSLGQDGFPGLAIATSFAAWVNAGALMIGLYRRDWYRPGGALVFRLAASLVASLLMGAALYVLRLDPNLMTALVPGSRFVEVIIFILIGICIYMAGALAFGAVRLKDFTSVK
jgi:putative peptidoglycan lipid II flippase